MTDTGADSPCIKKCFYDWDKGFCTGCGRTIDELSDWDYWTIKEKQEILEKSKKRLDSNKSI